MKEIKTASAKWLKTQGTRFSGFSWQQGYGAFSIGMRQKDALLRYIEDQETHHRTQSFQDEYRTFLEKYAINYDERYLWD